MTTFGFAEIVSAVERRDRTDQYVILAAMFCLGAAATPVSVRQVTQFIDLKLSGKKPSNVTASLRGYISYVERVEKGPPAKWKLTSSGLLLLRQASGLPLGAEELASAYSSDVGIVCALEDPEFLAVMEAIGGKASWKELVTPSLTHVYREAQLKTERQRTLRVIGVVASAMGLTPAAIVTTQLVMQFRPRLVMMVGIAAGTTGGGRAFGDVLVADPSVDYNSGKVVQDGGVRSFLPDHYPIGLNARLRSVLQKRRADAGVFSGIRRKWHHVLPGQRNSLHIGPVGAADQVIDDPSRIEEIRKHWRRLIGVEMETYAVYRACHESPEPKPRFLSMKSVCDFGASKTDSWQAYAAFTAAEYAAEFLRSDWDALWVTS